jgi:2-iminobutanoate/2-iminopropanoate deaminase
MARKRIIMIGDQNMKTRRVVSTSKAYKSKSPLSQAVATESLVFVSGQLGFPGDGGPMPTTVEDQTRFALENMKAVLEAAGCSLENVVKTTVFVTSIADVPKLNKIYAEYFSSGQPARSAVAVAALAGDALVEIEAIAVI